MVLSPAAVLWSGLLVEWASPSQRRLCLASLEGWPFGSVLEHRKNSTTTPSVKPKQAKAAKKSMDHPMCLDVLVAAVQAENCAGSSIHPKVHQEPRQGG